MISTPDSAGLQAVYDLEERLQRTWRHIHKAERSAHEDRTKLGEVLEGLTNADTSIVVFGSLARLEKTSGSDVDWTILVDGQADPAHGPLASECRRRIKESGFRQPGREGTFGDLAFSHELINQIGGQADTNANLTRRILLLLESVPIGPRDAYDRVIRGLLERYLSEDYGFVYSRNPHGVPRFLQNDIARFWRTMAVDVAYKQWTRGDEDWALRSAKLRVSRKVLYASGLLFCFSCADAELAGADRLERAIESLAGLVAVPPLGLLANAFADAPATHIKAAEAFDAYDQFIALLDDPERRAYLKALPSMKVDSDPEFQRVRDLGHAVQEGLNALFFGPNETDLPDLTRAYGVF